MSKARFLADLLESDGEVKASKVDAHSARKGSVGRTDLGIANQEQLTVDGSGNLTLPGTVDGVDIAARDAVLTSTNTTAGNALPKAGGTVTGETTFSSGAIATALTVSNTHPTLMLKTSGGGSLDQAYIQKYNNDLYVFNKESAGKLYLGTNNVTKVILTSSGGLTTTPAAGGNAVFNENSVDADFRVESSGNSHMLFVDGGANKVGVGDTPASNGSTLQVTADATVSSDLQFAMRGNTDNNKKLIMGFDTSTNIASITSLQAGIAHKPLHLQGSEFVWNEAGSNHDFRVESDNNSHMLFVDAGNNHVGIGNSSPSQTLDVTGSLGVSGNGTFGSQVSTTYPGVALATFGVYADGVKLNTSSAGNPIKIQNAGTTIGTFTSTGLDVTGTVTSDGLIVNYNTSMYTTDSSISSYAANNGLYINGNSAGYLALRSDGSGKQNITLYGDTSGVDAIYMTTNAALTLRLDSNGTLVTTPRAGGDAIFNENGVDADFRVESDTNTHALFVQGSDGYVGIGKSAPATALDVLGTIQTLALSETLSSAPNWPAGQLKIKSSNPYGEGKGGLIAFHQYRDAVGNGFVSSGIQAVGTFNSTSTYGLDFYVGQSAAQLLETTPRVTIRNTGLDVTGSVTADSLVVDNFTLDGTTLALSSGDMTLDVAGRISLDAGTDGDIRFYHGGTLYGQIFHYGNAMHIKSRISDEDIIFDGYDGGSPITALRLDMSAAGRATFNEMVVMKGISNTVTSAKFYSNSGASCIEMFGRPSDNIGGLSFKDSNGTAVGYLQGRSTDDTIRLWATGTNGLDFGAGGSSAMVIDPDGKVGIGTTAATNFPLTVNGAIAESNRLKVSHSKTGSVTTSFTITHDADGSWWPHSVFFNVEGTHAQASTRRYATGVIHCSNYSGSTHVFSTTLLASSGVTVSASHVSSTSYIISFTNTTTASYAKTVASVEVTSYTQVTNIV